jgi:hypothetical protein
MLSLSLSGNVGQNLRDEREKEQGMRFGHFGSDLESGGNFFV